VIPIPQTKALIAVEVEPSNKPISKCFIKRAHQNKTGIKDNSFKIKLTYYNYHSACLASSSMLLSLLQ
jgi:hypothetical protein